MSLMSEASVADTVAGTLNWARRQASSPLFRDIEANDLGEITLTVDLPGEQRFRLVVVEITDEETD